VRTLSRSSRLSVIGVTVALAVVLPWTWSAETADSARSKPTSAQAERGRYLLAVGNCNDMPPDKQPAQPYIEWPAPPK
jgi:hypothetical protein